MALSEKYFTCSKCGKKPPEVMDFTIGDDVVCHSCVPPAIPLEDVPVSEILKILKSWASEPHNGCARDYCRHDDAKRAIVEVNNALAKCRADRTAHESTKR